MADEVNVKDVRLVEDVASVAESVLQVVPAVAGPRLGPDVQTVIRAVRAGDWRRDGRHGRGRRDRARGGRVHPPPRRRGRGGQRLAARGDGVVVLDLAVTAELAAEGLARDLVRLVQQARRDAGLDVSDRIALAVGLPDQVRAQLAPHEGFIARETLATSVTWGPPADGAPLSLGDGPASVRVAAVASA